MNNMKYLEQILLLEIFDEGTLLETSPPPETEETVIARTWTLRNEYQRQCPFHHLPIQVNIR